MISQTYKEQLAISCPTFQAPQNTILPLQFLINCYFSMKILNLLLTWIRDSLQNSTKHLCRIQNSPGFRSIDIFCFYLKLISATPKILLPISVWKPCNLLEGKFMFYGKKKSQPSSKTNPQKTIPSPNKKIKNKPQKTQNTQNP